MLQLVLVKILMLNILYFVTVLLRDNQLSDNFKNPTLKKIITNKIPNVIIFLMPVNGIFVCKKDGWVFIFTKCFFFLKKKLQNKSSELLKYTFNLHKCVLNVWEEFSNKFCAFYRILKEKFFFNSAFSSLGF